MGSCGKHSGSNRWGKSEGWDLFLDLTQPHFLMGDTYANAFSWDYTLLHQRIGKC